MKCIGLGDSYGVRLRRRIPCPECEVELTAGTLLHARDRARNQLDLADGQPEDTPTLGIQREIPAGDKAIPLPLPRMPGVLPHI